MNQTAPAGTDGAVILDALTGDTNVSAQKTPRKHHSAFPVAHIVLRPEENYRWGSEEAMKADIANEDVVREDGTKACSFAMLKESVAIMGVEDPIGLVERENGYHVIYGFTRALAAQLTGTASLPAYVYEPGIPEAEVEMLQMRENSPTLKRTVNWVAETEMFTSISTRLLNRLLEKATAEAGGAELTIPVRKNLKVKADLAVCKIMGRYPSTFKSRRHFMHRLDQRVITLAREGRLSCTAAMEFHSGDVDRPFDPSFVTAVLSSIRGDSGYPPVITPEKVRNAMRLVRAEGWDSAPKPSAAAPSAESGFEGDDHPEPARTPRGGGEEGRAAGRAPLLKAPEKIRQSPSILRDLSNLVAWEALRARSITLASPEAATAKLKDSPEWHKIIGIGFGAGEVTMPPLMETIIAGRDHEEDDVQRMQNQHEHTADRYVTTAFIHAFMRQAMATAGVRNFDLDDKGWISQKATNSEGSDVLHRLIYGHAVTNAANLPPKDGALPTLLQRAQHAWSAISPYVAKSRAKR